MESFVKFSPVVAMAEKRGAGSLWLEPAGRPIALASRTVESAPRRKTGRTPGVKRSQIGNRLRGQRSSRGPEATLICRLLAEVAQHSPNRYTTVVFGPGVC